MFILNKKNNNIVNILNLQGDIIFKYLINFMIM